MRDIILGFGISPSAIKDCAGTGLVVDVNGTGPAVAVAKDDTSIHSVALRTDMDGLPMPENNGDLAYKTQTKHAHMCGHDGHMVTILSTL